MPPEIAPYDALLLVSFGGPEKPDDVVPFLENVTRGRGIPRERLEEVGEHYFQLGGRSPINDQNRALIAAIEEDLRSAGADLPVYWGNRNWDPFLVDALRQMAADGVRRAACFVTSAYSSYSGCRQYREDLAEAVAEVGGRPPARPAPALLQPPRVRADGRRHPGRARRPARRGPARRPRAVRDALGADRDGRQRPAGPRRQPLRPPAPQRRGRDRRAGPPGDRPPLRLRAGLLLRSGPPHVPWLEPDVNDRMEELAGAGARAVVVVPIGFVSDHMEVIYDLDTEAAATAEKLGIDFARAAAGLDGSSRWCATCSSSGPPSSAASRSNAPRSGRSRFPRRLPGRLLRRPARTRPALCGQD